MAWVASSLLLSVGCGQLSALPSEGGPQWIQIESEHFVLQTDMDRDDAVSALEHAERLLLGLVKSGWPSGGVLHLRLNLVIFASRSDYEHFGTAEFSGYHISKALFEPLVVMPAPTRMEGFGTLAHELAHYVAYQSLQFQPAWLSEGLAVYYETARFDRKGNFVIGGVPRALFGWLRLGLIPTARLMSPDVDRRHARFYATSWLLTHYLLSKKETGFATYQQALARGDDHVAAWRAGFGALDHQELDRLLLHYAEDGIFDNFTLPPPGSAPIGSPAPMSSADVSALRALLYTNCIACADYPEGTVRANVDAALRGQPLHLRASAVSLLHLRESSPTPDELRPLTLAHPSAWLPWFLLAHAEIRSRTGASDAAGVSGPLAAIDEPLARALELAPHQPHVLMSSAQRDVRLGQTSRGLSRAAKAVALQPTDADIALRHVMLLAQAGDCAQLGTRLEALANIAHERLAEDTLARLRELESGCAAAAAPRPD